MHRKAPECLSTAIAVCPALDRFDSEFDPVQQPPPSATVSTATPRCPGGSALPPPTSMDVMESAPVRSPPPSAAAGQPVAGGEDVVDCFSDIPEATKLDAESRSALDKVRRLAIQHRREQDLLFEELLGLQTARHSLGSLQTVRHSQGSAATERKPAPRRTSRGSFSGVSVDLQSQTTDFPPVIRRVSVGAGSFLRALDESSPMDGTACGLAFDESVDCRAFRTVSHKPYHKVSMLGQLSTGLERLGLLCVGDAVAWLFGARPMQLLIRTLESDEPVRTGCLARLVESKRFGAVCMACIALNAVFLVYTTDREIDARSSPSTQDDFVDSIEIAFLVFYLNELLLKLVVHRAYFLIGKEAGWNFLDLCLIGVSVVDLAFPVSADVPNMNVSFMRMIRLLKLAKVLRVFRTVRYFTELRLMFDCVVGSLVSLFWCLAMILCIVFIFAVLIVQSLGQELHRQTHAWTSAQEQQVLKDFGSVGTAMVTLIKSTTGGNEWGGLFEVLHVAGGILPWAYVAYILFFALAAWNIVTSLFVEKALKLAQPDLETMALEQHMQDVADAEELTAIFSALDHDRTGTISLRGMRELMEHPRFLAYLRVRGIEIQDADLFHKMLMSVSHEKTDAIDINFVVAACLRMKGTASSIDLHALSFEAKMISQKQRRHISDATKRLERIESSLGAVLATIAGADATRSVEIGGSCWRGANVGVKAHGVSEAQAPGPADVALSHGASLPERDSHLAL